MKQSRHQTTLRTGRMLALLLAVGGFALGSPGQAQVAQHLSITQPGGMPGLPVVTGITRTTNGANVTWDGPAGYYRLYQKRSLKDASWQPLGGLNLARNANVTNLYSSAFFKVYGPAPQYAGAATCAECHAGIHSGMMATDHARAFTNVLFVAQGGQTNSSCLPCHTVGYGVATGFISKTKTPQLAGVQCENCHGPAGNHAANPDDFSARPRLEIAATVCGGCHSGAAQPTYEEWKTSGHFAVVEDMSATNRVDSCGRCHSGSARLALLQGLNPLTVTNDANVGITCVVCHDPHAQHAWTNAVSGVSYTNQLRNPVSSTNDFFLTTTDTFTNKYNANINVCAQCHNHRGATWTSSSRPPHHSPQYNFLLGTVGELPAGTAPWRAAHGTLIENQCVGCHMQTADASGSQPAVTGHTFAVASFEACARCHGDAANAQALAVFVQDFVVAPRIQQIKAALDSWATTKAPVALRTKYGALAWEYTTPGELSTGTAGPDATEQSQIPDTIKKARFDLYLVLNDGSYGVHNAPFASSLLDAATGWVQQELSK